MEAIFGVEFIEVTFKTAYGLSKEDGGSLKWDGYCVNLLLNGKIYRIAFEYDGIQHDEFPNAWHRTRIQFDRQQQNDQQKNIIAQNTDKKTIIIRLKAKNGYDFSTIDLFEKEILSQFCKETGIRLSYKGYTYDLESNSLILKNGLLDKFL